jgi:hypothetical protein
MGNIFTRSPTVFGFEVALWILALQPNGVAAWNDHYDEEDGMFELLHRFLKIFRRAGHQNFLSDYRNIDFALRWLLRVCQLLQKQREHC